NPVIGRNSQRAAEVEATMLNPASTPQQRLAAAKEWLSLKALSPYDGLNQNENGKFLRWRELSLAYNLPTTASQRLGLRYITLKASVRNLALWTGYKGIDPELNVYGRGTADAGLGQHPHPLLHGHRRADLDRLARRLAQPRRGTNLRADERVRGRGLLLRRRGPLVGGHHNRTARLLQGEERLGQRRRPGTLVPVRCPG